MSPDPARRYETPAWNAQAASEINNSSRNANDNIELRNQSRSLVIVKDSRSPIPFVDDDAVLVLGGLGFR
jgi:hypothetical protein